MPLAVFNRLLLAGWLLALIGGLVLNPGAGLLGAGLLLIALTLVCVRLGGLVPPNQPDKDGD